MSAVLENVRPVSLDESSFDSFLGADGLPVVVDFWAPWCGPCRVMAPAFEQAAGELHGRARLAKVNVDESPRLAMRYGIRAIPTIVLFKGAREFERSAGAMSASSLVDWVEQAL